jgi:hypothetical protein
MFYKRSSTLVANTENKLFLLTNIFLLWQQVDISQILSCMLSSRSINEKLQSSSEQPMASKITQVTFLSRAKRSSNLASGNSAVVISTYAISSKVAKEVCLGW